VQVINVFWKDKTLAEMSEQEWESLCDGCGQCCLQKLEDEDTGDVFYTDLACRLYDLKKGGCKDYPHRLQRVSNCIKLGIEDIPQFHWLPSSCAYRLLSEGKALPAWHPLRSGDPESVKKAGFSIRGRAVCESTVAENLWEERIIQWVE